MSLQVVTAQPDDFRARVVIPLPHRSRPMVDIVIPVRNAERDLASSVRRLHAYLAEHFPFTTRITIADNASTDSTPAIATRLAAELPHVRVLRLNEKGRGRALAAAWLTSEARVVTFLDVDLPANLSVILPLVAPVISGRSVISVGGHRKLKALRADVARRLIPKVLSRSRIFDWELLLRAERAGLRIHELSIA